MIFPDKSSISTAESGENNLNMSKPLHRSPARQTTSVRPPVCSKGLFITGTDTNVGKTVLTVALGLALQKQGLCPGVMKPTETGVGPSSPEDKTDSSRLQSLLAVKHPRDVVTPYQFPAPLAPLAASRHSSQPIRFQWIMKCYQELSKSCDVLLVEGAGGVMVPLTDKQTMRELIAYLHLPCLVVCRPTLGAVNHTLLTLEALAHRKIQVFAIVLNQSTSLQASEREQHQIESTMQLIRELAHVSVVGPLPFEPLLTIDWRQGVMKLADNPSIMQLIEILQFRW